MTHRQIGRIHMIAIAFAALAMTGCAASPGGRPLATTRIEAGSGSLTETRKRLEGTWKLESLEVVDNRGAARPVKAGGELTYDEFGNMTVRGVIEDPALKNTLVLDYAGRVTMNPVRHEFYPADLVSDRPVEPGQVKPISPDKVTSLRVVGRLVRRHLPRCGSEADGCHQVAPVAGGLRRRDAKIGIGDGENRVDSPSALDHCHSSMCDC